jgi:hypothetical protein
LRSSGFPFASLQLSNGFLQDTLIGCRIKRIGGDNIKWDVLTNHDLPKEHPDSGGDVQSRRLKKMIRIFL